ncbi:MAG: glycoside hydrolase family 32 protein [Bacteroidales bacterium]|nr:glycoside hydrolase family 32 protein [Bacteroidales bacterium]
MKYINRILINFLFLVCAQINASAQYYPHVEYSEPFRGQYHFSPKTGWMNDINGLVYQGGKYHMIYQWGHRIRHGGYATSTDLVHWKDEGVALIPKRSDLPRQAIRNVSGDQVFSGSAVVVSGETSKKITGTEQEAIVAIYTGTRLGTCLAWSIDSGSTWHDYQNNPVANPTDGVYPRDPCVFYHKPSSKWVMALYENGTTFYSSEDLIKWTYLSNINFGYECPDIFELPLDGNEKNMKWVLMDANGSYLVGHFDGIEFKPDKGQEVNRMTFGPDFYAAQTFPTDGLKNGDKRKIQIAWMDNWNGGLGETTWERNATFPVYLGLVSYNGQMRLTRTPIEEISLLYKNNKIWESQIIKSDNLLFDKIRSKTFDLVAEFDLTNTTASRFGFQVANKFITYHVKSQVLLDETLKPDVSNKVRIRILVDWGQLEVFANQGIFSYAEQFAFSPDNRGDILFFTDGNIKLVSMEFNEVSKIW